MLKVLPIDIWYNILNYLHTSEKSELFEVIPDLRSYSNNLLTIIRFTLSGNTLLEDLATRDYTNSIHTLTLPIDSIEDLISGCKQDSLKAYLDDQIATLFQVPEIKQKLRIERHRFLLQFAFDLESPSTYESMELYLFLWHHFKNTPHSVEIIKSEQDSILNFTKSKYHNLNLFDCCFSSTLNGGQTVLSRDFKDLVIDTAPQLIQLDSGDLIRTCHFFQDTPVEQRHSMLNIHTSGLKEISIVTPLCNSINPKKTTPPQYRNSNDNFKDYELSFTFRNWDIKMANLAFDLLMNSKADSVKNFVEKFIQNSDNSVRTFPFPNFPNIKLAQNNHFQDINYGLFYEIIYHIFNHSSQWELSLTKDGNDKSNGVMSDFWKKYVQLLYDHIYVSYHFQISTGQITNNNPKFLKIKILGGNESLTNAKLIEEYTKYFNRVYHSDSRHLRLIGFLRESNVNLIEA